MPGYGSADSGTASAQAVFLALGMNAGQLNAFLVKYPLFAVAVQLTAWQLAKNVLQAAQAAGDVTAQQVSDVRAAVSELN